MKKICSGCNELRDIEKDFAWKNRAKGIRQRWCKLCQAEANRKHYQNNKQTYINHAHQYESANKGLRTGCWGFKSSRPCQNLLNVQRSGGFIFALKRNSLPDVDQHVQQASDKIHKH